MTYLPEIYGTVDKDEEGFVDLYFDYENRKFIDCNGDPVGNPEDVMPEWLWYLFRSSQRDIRYELDGMRFIFRYPEDLYWPGHYSLDAWF